MTYTSEKSSVMISSEVAVHMAPFGCVGGDVALAIGFQLVLNRLPLLFVLVLVYRWLDGGKLSGEVPACLR